MVPRRTVHPPSRSDVPSAALIVASTLALGAATAIPRGGDLAGAALLAVASALAVRTQRRLAATIGLLCALALAAVAVPALHSLWPAPLLLGLAGGAAAARLLREREAFRWLGRGTFTPEVRAWVFVTVFVSAAVLLTWFIVVRPRAAGVAIPRSPAAFAVAGVAVWSGLNALAEEFVYRGALMHALGSFVGQWAAWGLQGFAFGLAHLRATPAGWLGVALAAAYGLMLGAIQRRARGMLAPWVAHVCADILIAANLALAR